MAKKKSFLESKGFKTVMKYLYGIGAAVVIAGALFKIMHWPGAAAMLIIGMSTEVLIFVVSAFEPLHEDLDWTRVYPQLAEESEADFEFEDEEGQEQLPDGMGVAELEQNLKKVDITPDLFESLSGSLTGLKDNVSQLANIENASVATNEFTENIRSAGAKVSALSDGFSQSAESMSNMASSASAMADNAKAYHEQVQNVTKNLSSLNAVYELELKDTQEHIKSLNKFYGSLADAMGNMVSVSEDTKVYKKEVAEITKNLQQLNSIYGGMLSAMSGSGGAKGGAK